MTSEDFLIRLSVVFKKFGLVFNEFFSVICQFLNVTASALSVALFKLSFASCKEDAAFSRRAPSYYLDNSWKFVFK